MIQLKSRVWSCWVLERLSINHSLAQNSSINCEKTKSINNQIHINNAIYNLIDPQAFIKNTSDVP